MSAAEAAAAPTQLTPEEQQLSREVTVAELAAAPEGSLPFEAWFMDEDTETDQRAPHRLSPNKPCPAEVLYALGCRVWALDADAFPNDPKLAAIRKARGYNYEDCITCTPEALPNYEEKLKNFYEEHLHTDEEIRYVLDGSGYFDVRDAEDRWIRIWTKKGALLVVPEGIYHRFTLDEGDYIKALRLFSGVPVWTPVNRPADDHPSRSKYLSAWGLAA